MLKHSVKILLCLSPLLFFSFSNAQENKKKRPNIIFILADDLGYMDLVAYASKVSGENRQNMFYETPNIDKMADEGIAFSQAYSCPLCSPTRASLMTGKYAARLGFMTATAGSANTFYTRGEKPPAGFTEQTALWGDKIEIEQAWINGYTNIALPSGQPQDKGLNETTIAEALTNYTSAFIGKWHLGGHGTEGYQPRDQGFRELAYYDSGGSPFFNWRKLWDRKEKWFPKMRQTELAQGNSGKPTGKDYLTDDLTEQAVDFIDEQVKNKEKQPFLLYFCEFAVHTPLQAPKEDSTYFANKTTKGWNGHNNAIYAAMMKKLDNSVGRIMQKLKETGLDDNTILVFMADNGGISWDEKSALGRTTNNAPLKGGKAMVYEGGIRVPLIFWQKGTIKPQQWCDVPVDCNDIFPTLLQVAGQKTAHLKIDGQSLKPLFNDPQNTKKGYKRNTFYWHYPLNVKVNSVEDGLDLTPHSAIRKGDFKLIFDWHGRLKLYNIKDDMSEKNNLAFSKPELTKALFADLINWLEQNVETKYFPTENPNYKPEKEARKVPFVNLYKGFKAGKDVVQMAH